MAGKSLTFVTYQLLLDAYKGAGGFKDGSYLVQHKREAATNYTTRQEIAYYLNYTLPVVNSHVNPIFRKDPTRILNGTSTYWDLFVKDVDLFKTSMTSFMKQSGFISKLMGVSFIVVDNFEEASKSKNLAEAIQNRQFPYCYIVSPDRIANYQLDRYGKLLAITYTEDYEDPSAGQINALEFAKTIAQSKSKNINVMPTNAGASTGQMNKPPKVQYRTWTTTEWIVTDEDGVQMSGGTHNLGRVPVIPHFSQNITPGEILPESEFYSIVKTNLRLFNLCSELDEILRNQAFALLCYPGKDVPSLVVGPNNAIGFDGKDNRFAPSFIAPPAAPAEMLMNQIDRLVTEMYRMAMLTHTGGAKSEARTGSAKAWEFEVTNQVLATFSSNCEIVEIEISELFGLWTSATLDYQCTYPDDFSIRDSQQELTEAALALGLKIGGLYDQEIKKKVAAVTLKDVNSADLQAVLTDIDARVDQQPDVTDVPADKTVVKQVPASQNAPPGSTTPPVSASSKPVA